MNTPIYQDYSISITSIITSRSCSSSSSSNRWRRGKRRSSTKILIAEAAADLQAQQPAEDIHDPHINYIGMCTHTHTSAI